MIMLLGGHKSEKDYYKRPNIIFLAVIRPE